LQDLGRLRFVLPTNGRW